MVFPGMRALVAGVLFVGWLAFLAFLVIESHGRIIVATPQIERAERVVVAELIDDQGRPAALVKIRKVLYPRDVDAQQFAGTTIDLKELAFFSSRNGWQGAGEYVVPLSADQVAPLPLSPGFLPMLATVRIEVGKTPDLLAQKIAALTGMPVSRLRPFFDGEFAFLREISLRTEKDEKSLFDAVRDGGGKVVDVRRSEARIYRATRDVIRQIEAILP